MFGNSIAWVDFPSSAAVLRVDNEIVVDRTAPFPERTLHRPFIVTHPVRYDAMEQAVVSAYLATSYPDDVASLSTWAGTALQVDPADAEGTVLQLAQLIHRDIEYRRRDPARSFRLHAYSGKFGGLQERIATCRYISQSRCTRFNDGLILGVAAKIYR